jgi:hypothetical protein
MHNRLLFVRYVFVFVLNPVRLSSGLVWVLAFVLVLVLSLGFVLSFRRAFGCILGLGLGLLLLLTFGLILSYL